MKNNLDNYPTPKEIVAYLDKYIIGQDKAKKAVAIALRNRWRRLRIKGKLKEEIWPANIIMIGPTGVGKTEIARRLASFVKAPFVKVEATKFTEVGYVGRDVESMVRELVNISVNMVKKMEMEKVKPKAEEIAKSKITDTLAKEIYGYNYPRYSLSEREEILRRLREDIEKGLYDDRLIEIDVEEKSLPFMKVIGPTGIEDLNASLSELFENFFPAKRKRKRMPLKEALKILIQEEAQKLMDMDKVVSEGLKKAQEEGIIFIDEIDKIVSKGAKVGPDVSREGVQRDLLPIVEGSMVMTKYGMVKTDHILFIAAGAFHDASPQDLIPELQGRFPIRVELNSLTAKDFERILVEPENSLVKQYKALFKAEGVELEFEKEAIQLIAQYSAEVNQKTEDIGARRLHTVMNVLLEDYLYYLPDLNMDKVTITADYVKQKLEGLIKDVDLTRYIL